MGALRRIVFPALRIVIWAVIAVSLAWLAFKPGATGESQAGPLEPSSNFADPLITPVRGDVSNRITLSGTVVPDASREITATTSGTVHRLWVGTGDVVDGGAPLVVLKELLGEGTDENLFTTTTVWASAAGTVTMDVELGAEVEAGDVVAKISPGTYVIEADVEPHQMYQLIDAPGTAAVTITNGPPEFACKTFATEVVEGEEGVSTRATCFVPADVLVFPGLAASVDIVTDSATGVLLLPVTAVEGTVGEGKVWQRAESGELVAIEVGLGLTDGEMIEITSGLKEADEVLEFVPGASEDMYGPGLGWEEFPDDFDGEEWVDEEGFVG